MSGQQASGALYKVWEIPPLPVTLILGFQVSPMPLSLVGLQP